MEDVRIHGNPVVQNERDRRDRALRRACREFEAVFTYELLKGMRRTVEKCDLFHGGQGEEIYQSFLDQELAKGMAGMGRNGLADLLFRQLRRVDPPREGKGLEAYRDLLQAGGVWPLEGRVSSGFGWRRDPLNGQTRFHQGIDIAAPEGTQVRASRTGKVVLSGHREGYGNVVVLDHGDGVSTLYAHHQVNLVREGEWVGRGSPLGKVGSSGRSTGPHLHFEVRRDGRRMDPRGFLGQKICRRGFEKNPPAVDTFS